MRGKKAWKPIAIISIVLFVISAYTLGILGTIGFAFSMDTKDYQDTYRYCLYMTNDQIYDDGGGGDSTGIGEGWFEIDLSRKKAKFELLFGGIGTPLTLAIHGPVNSTSAFIADQFFPRNGSIADLEISDDGFYRGSASIDKSDAKDIVNDSSLYYILLKTSDYTSGAIGARLYSMCRDEQ